jgi:hypothetical protein
MECRYQQLSQATSVAEIVQLTRDYLASWSLDELERLPDSCRPGRVGTAADIEAWADRLAGESGKTAMYMEDERKLDRLVSHFLIASVRMRQIEGESRLTLAA